MNNDISLLTGTIYFLGGLLLICAYSSQYWAYRCHKELKAMREELARRPHDRS